MKLVSLKTVLRIGFGLYAILCVSSAQTMDTDNIDLSKQSRSISVVQNALRGCRVRKKTMQQLKLDSITELVVVEEKKLSKTTYILTLWNKDFSLEYGKIRFFTLDNVPSIELSLMRVDKKFHRLGIGTYLFNAMLKQVYKINADQVRENKKPYKRITWSACPLGAVLDEKKALRQLIKFYKSLGGKVSSLGSVSARMYFALEQIY